MTPSNETQMDEAVVPLDNKAAYRSSVPCKVCSNNAFPFDVVDLNKQCSRTAPYPDGFSGTSVAYHRCRACGAIFSPFFEGQAQADSNFRADRHQANASDNQADAPATAAGHLLSHKRKYRNARVLAYGIGAHALAARLRHGGYRNVEAFEPASTQNGPIGRFDILVAVDCIEHTLEPVEAVQDMCRHLASDGCIILEQELQPEDIREVRGNWWYIGPWTGHVCTYSADALALLAQACGLTFHEGKTVHGFSRQLMSALSTHVLSTLGKPRYFAPLLAPAIDARPSGFDWRCWSESEIAAAGGFRWSRSNKLAWLLPPLHHLPATLRLVMPFCDRITAEFLQGVHTYQGWNKTDFHVVGSDLVADLQVSSPMTKIYVDTPMPVTPRTVRGDPDDRRLGIAVLSQR